MSRYCLSPYPRLLGIRDAVFTALGNFAHNAFITKIKELSVSWPSSLILLSIVSVSLGGITLECLIWKAAIWDLFHGASKAVSRVKMKLNPFPRPSAARSSLKGRWTQSSDFLWEAHGHRNSFWCSGWRVERDVIGIRGGNNTQGFLSNETRCLDPRQNMPAVE